MKIVTSIVVLSLLVTCQANANEVVIEQKITKLKDRKSIIVNKTDFKKYFSGGKVRIDPVYPKSNAKTHSGAYVTFEPGSRTNWHTHPTRLKHWHGASKYIAMTHMVVTNVDKNGKNVD